jgi:hypothetical protein
MRSLTRRAVPEGENAMKPSHKSLGLAGFVSVVATLGASWIAGCSLEATESRGREGSAQQADARAAELVGTWRFVYTDERRHAVEAQLAAEIRDPAQLAAAGREAEEEATASEIEFTREGWFLSRIAGKEIARAPYNAVPAGRATLRVSMSKGSEIRTTEVDLTGAGEIVIHDPQKGALSFRRAAP